MALTLAEIRAKLAQQDEKKSGGAKSTSFGDGTVYPHWNIQEGETARIRFLPDANSKNPYFWVEKAMIKLTFAGIKGDPTSKPVVVQVPCIEMFPGYENKCPILAEVRPWYKDPDGTLKELANKYWKKRSYIFQGFVRENPMKEDKSPENPIRRFIISPQIFTLVKAALMDPEMENLPTDYENGLDFSVLKTSKGQYADYNTSKWSRKESALTSDEAGAVEQYGLANLTDALPKMPTQEELDIMVEMFHASVDGEAYDGDKWGKYFKPSGFKGGTDDDTTSESKSTAPSTPAPVVKKVVAPTVTTIDEDDTPEASAPVVTPAATAASGSRAEDILAMIRNRQKTT